MFFEKPPLPQGKSGMDKIAMKKSACIKIRAGLMKNPGFEAPAALQVPA
jgi:hypothetical protein